MAVKEVPDWDELYRTEAVEKLPWFHPALDPDVKEALEGAQLPGARLLDIGSGPGTQAIALAKAGYQVTGTDVSATAVQKATERARAEGVQAAFVQDDILASRLQGPFDGVLDRGCFHIFEAPERSRYVQCVARLLRPGGLLLLKTFSVKQPGDFGPKRFAPEDLRALFSAGFDIRSIRESVYQGTLQPLPLALFAVMVRRAA